MKGQNRMRKIYAFIIGFMVLLVGCVPAKSNSDNAEMPVIEQPNIDIRVESPISRGVCYQLGEAFPLTVNVEKPADWKGFDSGEVVFSLKTINPETDVITFQNETQELSFELAPGETARGSIKIVLEGPSGDSIAFGIPDFPYFKYVKREGNTFCVALPDRSEYIKPEPMSILGT